MFLRYVGFDWCHLGELVSNQALAIVCGHGRLRGPSGRNLRGNTQLCNFAKHFAAFSII